MAGICFALGAIVSGVIFAAVQLKRIADVLEDAANDREDEV